jgi:uncharacterized membrane protein
MSTAVTTPARPRSSAALAWAIFVLAAAGLVLSAVSLVSHYRTSATEFCDIGDTFNCDIVNRSIYSTIGPIPVAGIGVAGYAALMALAHLARNRRMALTMFVTALVGLAFALYLTYIEAYVLVVWCILCLGSLAMISLVTLLSVWQTLRFWRA